MNRVLARSMYIQDQKVYFNDVSDPHTTILIVMKELNKSLRKIVDPANPASKVRTELSKAFTSNYILQSSLDFANGGEIAENLYRLYEYCRQQLLKAFALRTDHNIGNCIVLLDEIIQAWEGIGDKKEG